MTHPIENIMKSSMEHIKQMVDVNTIVGSPIMTGAETMILPVSRVSLGFVSGGGEYGRVSPVRKSVEAVHIEEERYPFAGAAVAGMCITPIAFLSVNNGEVKVLPAHYSCTVDRIIELVPQTIKELEKAIIHLCCCAKGEYKEETHTDDQESVITNA